MNEKRATKLCRKIYGPPQTLPKKLSKAVTSFHQETIEMIEGCFREYIDNTRDPRDYVSCTMTTFTPNSKPRLTILSTQEMLLPEIVIQCAQTRFDKMKKRPFVKSTIRLEKVFHHIVVTKG